MQNNDSRLADYLTQAETLAGQVAAMAPQSPPAEIQTRAAESRIEKPFGEERPTDPAWAQARAFVTYGKASGASAAAGAAVAEQLEADGWTKRPVREVDDVVTEGFRKDIDGSEWYVETAWSRPQDGMAQNLDILVVSPPTVRGDAAR